MNQIPTQVVVPAIEKGRLGVSACLIVRDEERLLPECLASVRPWVEEICVLDTGSKDRTVSIAQSFGVKLATFPFGNDFSAARNASLQLATWPWILVIDADEVLDPRTGPELRQAIAKEGALAYFVTREDQLGGGQSSSMAVVRLFRNLPEIRFNRPVHEDVSESLLRIGYTNLTPCGVRLTHRGFLPEVLAQKDKLGRNLSILRARVQQVPDDLYSTFQLATTLVDPGQADERHGAFLAAYELAQRLSAEERGRYPFLPLIYSGLSASLANRGEMARALTVVKEGLASFAGDIDLSYRHGDLLRRTGDRDTAARILRPCVGAQRTSMFYAGDPAVRGVLPALGLALMAIEAGNTDAAMGMIGLALRHDASNLEARCLQVRAFLISGQHAKVASGLDELMTQHSLAPQVQTLGGELAWLRRDPYTAMDLWRGAVASAQGAGGAGRSGEAVNDARASLAIGELIYGSQEAALLLQPTIVARDLPSAATKILLALVAGTPLAVDPAFRSDVMRRHLVFLLSELLQASRTDLVELFMRNAHLLEDQLPGITQMVSVE